ncbi:MAG TPA: hypothetical protein VGF48_07105 [Thermoanaerobaculia bacterium]
MQAAALREAKERLKLSDKKLAVLADVSRAHVAAAQRGANISRDVLKKLMRTLQMKEIQFDDGAVLRLGGIDRIGATLEQVVDAAGTIARAVREVQATLRASVAVADEGDLKQLIRDLELHLQHHRPSAADLRTLEKTLDTVGSSARSSTADAQPRKVERRRKAGA